MPTKITAVERQDAIAALRRLGVKPGARIYVICTHVARSGMSRHIKLYLPGTYAEMGRDDKRHKTPCIIGISGYVAIVLGYRRANDGALIVNGGGMDMGFHVVYNLGRTLFPKGGPLAASNNIRQSQAERDAVRPEPLVEEAQKAAGLRPVRTPAPREEDGGYLLRHEWL